MKYIPLKKYPNVSMGRSSPTSVSLQTDGRGYPHIAWSDSVVDKSRLNYSYWDGLKWSFPDIPPVDWTYDNILCSSSMLSLDDNESPLIAVAQKDGESNVLSLLSYDNEWNKNQLQIDYEPG